MEPCRLCCCDAALAPSLDRSMLKLDRRERGGNGEDELRFRGCACKTGDVSCGPRTADCFCVVVCVSSDIGTFSFAVMSDATGAETCRFPPFVSEPRFVRRMLPALVIQFPGDENVIDIERRARFEGVPSGVDVFVSALIGV